jgi:hypothetical protein
MQAQSTFQAAPPPPPTMTQGQASAAPKPTAPYTPGPELTPGTTASLMHKCYPPQPRNAFLGASSINSISGAGPTASDDGRTSGCPHADDAGAVPTSSGQRPDKTSG